MSPRVLHVVIGPARHGVTRHALGLLAHAPLRRHEVVHVDDAAGLARLPDADLTHLHLTDHLLAPTAGECADVVTRLADDRALSLTLHDLPQPADGEGRYERRRAAYAAMAARSEVVVVASAHERALLATATAEEARPPARVEIVPLPLTPPPAHVVRPAEAPRQLAVFGYVYPGKGLDAAVEAAPAGVPVVAIGEVSPGHEAWTADLTDRARARGVDLTVTGHVPDADVAGRLQTAGVPVAPHRHVSASGSIGSWLAAGRRPFVPVGAYVDELESRCPGALLRYGPGTPWADLDAAARAGLADPDLTWLPADVRLGPDEAECAAMLADLLDAVAAGVTR